MSASVLTVASSSFQAARRIPSLPPHHRCHGAHGHSFLATGVASLPADWPAWPGGEVGDLRECIEGAIAPLNYSDLNGCVEQPTDENVALWLKGRLHVPGLVRVALRSTPDQGVDLDALGVAHVWRKFRFKAAHRLPNVPAGHKCGRMHGHGFEVILRMRHVIEYCPATLVHDQLADAWSVLDGLLNFQCLNEIEGLSNPTSEVISAWIWQRLKPSLPELSRVEVLETGSCGARFDGAHYGIWKAFTLDSAVQFKRAPTASPLRRVHGHTFTLRLHLSATLDQVTGWITDFGDVKINFDPIFRMLDHQPLHEIAQLPDADTASLAGWIFGEAKNTLPGLVRVDLLDSDGGGVLYCDVPDSSGTGS